MSHHEHPNHESPFSSSFTSDGSHSAWRLSDHSRAVLPRLVVAFQASDSPVAAQGSTHVPYELPNYPLAPQQQIHAPYVTSPSLQQLSEAGYNSSQTHIGFHNTSGSADPSWDLPLEIPGGGRLQGLPYNPSHADPRIPLTLYDLRSQHPAYPPALSFSQSHSAAGSTYSVGDSSSRRVVPTIATANTQCHQSMDMSIASLDYNIPGPRGTRHLPCARVSTVPPHVPCDVSTTKPTIKKKRKHTDARQLEALNRVYARTPYPPTEERYQLASDLDMCPRRVQVWFQNRRQTMRRSGQNVPRSPISQVTHPPDTPPVAVHSRNSPAPVSSMNESCYPSFSPPLGMMSSGQTPSSHSGRPCANIDPRGHWPQAGPSRGY